MFGIFDDISEPTIIFKENRLIYANTAACMHLKSYSVTLLKKEWREIFFETSIEEITEKLKDSEEFRMKLKLPTGESLSFKIKAVDYINEGYILLQAGKKDKENDRGVTRIIAPRAIYDPIKAGIASIYNYKLADSFMKVSGELRELSDIPEANKKASDIEKHIIGVYEEFKNFAGELLDIDERYMTHNIVFSVTDLLERITARMNTAFRMENEKARVIFEDMPKHEPIIVGDYLKIGSSVVTLITVLINILKRKNKSAEVRLILERDKDFCNIRIISEKAYINNKTYEEIIRPDVKIINLKRYGENRLTFNIHIAGAYIELNNGELLINRSRHKGTEISVKFPLVKKKFYIMESNDEIKKFGEELFTKIALYLVIGY